MKYHFWYDEHQREDLLFEENEIQNRMEQDLIDDFLEFEDAVCTAIVDVVCDEESHAKSVEGTCCLRKRRRVMNDAKHLAEAWEGAENLKKIFRKNSLPQHFIKVCQFLNTS